MAVSSPIKPSVFLIPARLQELRKINTLSKQIYKEKRDRFLLEKRLYKLEQRSLERSKLQERESNQEKRKKAPVKDSILKFAQKQATGLGSFLFDLLQFFITYKALEWVGKPENKKKVVAIVKALKGIFDFINWFVTGTIDNAFSGLHSVLFGSNLLERFVGFFRLLIGLLGFRYLLRPGKLFKDLGFVIKNSGKILDIFNSFRKSGLKEGADKLLQSLPKIGQLFKRGLSRAIGRGLLKVFGKGGVRIFSKLLGPIFGVVKKAVLAPLKAVAKRTVAGIPIVGPLLDLGINLILGDPIDKAIVKAVGSTLGMGLGGLIGSAIPGPGTIVGGMLGGLLGDWAADKLYGWVKGMFSKKEENTPKLAVGGVVTRPTTAIIGEAGPEAVIPLPQLFSTSIISAPLGLISSSIIGGVNAVLFSMGPIGSLIRPFAQQLFAPYTKEFGSKKFGFASNIGTTSTTPAVLSTKTDSGDNKNLEKIVGQNKSISLLNQKRSDKKARYNKGNSIREILADIFNNIMNLEMNRGGNGNGKRNPGAGGAGGGMLPGDAPPEVKAMLEAISGGEGSWDSVNPSTTVAGLSNMTIAEARKAAMQKGYSLGGSGAMGKWQQMPEFILERARSSGLNPDRDKFNQENQTKIARMLMASVYPGGEAQLVKDAQQDPLSASAKLRGTWPSLPGGSQQNTSSQQFLSRFNGNVEKYKKMSTGGSVVKDRPWNSGIPLTTLRTKSGKSFEVASALAPKFKGFIADLESTGYRITAIGGWRKAGSGGGTGPADPDYDKGRYHHPYGASIDINPDQNPYRPDGKLITNFPPNINQIAKKWGLGWGGNWRSSKDTMHFSAGSSEGGSGYDMNTGGALWQGKPVTSGDSTTPSTDVQTDETEPPAPEWSSILKDLNSLYTGLTGKPKTNGAELQRNSMNMIQAQQTVPIAFNPDTYIIAPPTTVANSLTVVNTIPSQPFAINNSFAAFDTSTNYLSRL